MVTCYYAQIRLQPSSAPYKEVGMTKPKSLQVISYRNLTRKIPGPAKCHRDAKLVMATYAKAVIRYSVFRQDLMLSTLLRDLMAAWLSVMIRKRR
ncbi:hypothetical protein EVAR_74081_1 [Eumeta japonica]|uniref:Uncharacterized protein n=1 Tax=Eumeta variegata TaxID=151549 RepID=A0A4C1SBJ7_EUMVA|nr:hypothetical protein EVAR_74081_1 [Eumeta japonica]